MKKKFQYVEKQEKSGRKDPPCHQLEKNNRGKYKIEELVAKIPKNSKFKEVDWGKPRGCEEWWKFMFQIIEYNLKYNPI